MVNKNKIKVVETTQKTKLITTKRRRMTYLQQRKE
jgi:hypothetical protein